MLFIKSYLGLFICLLIGSNCIVAQIYYYPEQTKKGKWGIKRSDNGPGGKPSTKEWLFEPKWNTVYRDTSDSWCKTSTSCDCFITELNGKLGCVWAMSGVQLDNLYDEIDIAHKKIKLNGKFAVIVKEKIVTGFDYDDMFACSTPLGDAYYKTHGFCVKQNGKLGVIFVDIGKTSPNNISTIVPFEYDDYKPWVKGVILLKNNQWGWFNTQNSVKPAPSFTCDSLIENGPFWYVKKNDQWALISDFPNIQMITKPWDKIEQVPNTKNYIVHEKGNTGLIRLVSKSDRLKEELIIPLKVSSIKAEKTIDGSFVFVCEDGNGKSIYNLEGKLLNNTGDINITSSVEAGPFKINNLREKNSYGYTKSQVIDNATGKILYEDAEVNFTYKSDKDLGHIVEVNKFDRSGWSLQGIYHYNSKQFIQCNKGFKKLNNYVLFTNNTRHTIYDLHDLKKVETPFTILEYKEGNDPLIKDQYVWHKLDAKFTVVNGDSIFKKAITLFNGMVIHVMESGQEVLFSLNGKIKNELISNYKWLIEGQLVSLEKNGVDHLYMNYVNTVVPCKFIASGPNKPFYYKLSGKSWKSLTEKIPLALIDSANTLVVVNLFNNERWHLPQPTQPKTIFWKQAKIVAINPFEDVVFSIEEIDKCTDCNNGYVTAGTGTRTIKGTTSYETVKEYTTKTETENVWDSRTNSYKPVTRTRTVPTYRTVETKSSDKTESYQKTSLCSQCNGKKTYLRTYAYSWNGKTLTTKN